MRSRRLGARFGGGKLTKLITYLCAGTKDFPEHEFDYLHHPSVEEDPPPRFCPRCGRDSLKSVRRRALVTPKIQKPIKASVDNLHREMEAGAEFRAQVAQEQFGLTADEAAAIKITDSKDSLRAGETSDAPVNNAISQVMELPGAQQVFGFQGGAGAGYSGTVPTGPYPNAGAHAMSALRQSHAQHVAGSGMVGAATSSLPALETLQPGYRRRVA